MLTLLFMSFPLHFCRTSDMQESESKAEAPKEDEAAPAPAPAAEE